MHIRSRMHGLLHSLHGLVPSSMDSTCSKPLDLWTGIKPELPLRSPCYRNTSTLDLNSTHASPLRTRPACLSPSHCEKSTRLHPPHREASLQMVARTTSTSRHPSAIKPAQRSTSSTPITVLSFLFRPLHRLQPRFSLSLTTALPRSAPTRNLRFQKVKAQLTFLLSSPTTSPMSSTSNRPLWRLRL